MKLKNTLVILAVVTLPLIGTVAPAATIEVLQTFDFPGAGNSTLPQKISDQGVMVGTVIDVNGVEKGFFYKPRIMRFSDESFSEPSDTGKVTRGRGINNQRHACGEYKKSDGTLHGYTFEHPNFTPFDVAGALDTIPLGLNNGGDFVGTTVFSDGTQPGFISSGGVVTTFTVPGATATVADQLNRGSLVIGYYIDASGVSHGFTRDKRGNLTYPINLAGATGTMLLGNNDLNWGVGKYTDTAGKTHGLFFITADTILTYDYPGSTSTALTGVNGSGFVSGYYLDANGLYHGIWAKINE